MIKSSIASMMVHSFTIYSWPMSLIKELEKSIKNFIWSSDINKYNLIFVAWSKVCKPLE